MKRPPNTVMDLTATHRGVRGDAAHLLRAAAAHYHVGLSREHLEQ